jgi:hypothetical protein
VAALFSFPILNEMILSVKGARQITIDYDKEWIPIVYSPKYDMTLYGLEKFHPFDINKYKRVIK